MDLYLLRSIARLYRVLQLKTMRGNCKAGNYNAFICNSKRINGHLTLTLLMTRVLADHAHDTLTPDDLAIAADFFDRSQHFHKLLL